MEPDFKRPKMAQIPPSPVVHIRSLPPHTTPQDIHAALEPFGAIVNVSLIPNRSQGLAEFTDVHTASRCVYSSQQGTQPVFVKGRQVYINFSTSQKVHTQAGDTSQPYAVPGKVLMMTVMNASYPINVDVIYAVCSPLGRVLRIVMIRKNGVQSAPPTARALVEFPDANTAAAVMSSLQGANIYQGCCTLRIEYSKADRVNVRYNSEETRDFTVNLPPPPAAPAHGGYGSGAPQHGHHHHGGAPAHHAPDPYDPYRSGGYQPRSSYPPRGAQASWGGERRPRPCPPSVVLMVYHINKGSISCQKLFNLFCLYANPIKIKVLVSRDGMAMAQFEDLDQAKSVLEMLEGVEVQGQRIELGYSRNQELTESPAEVTLPSGLPAMEDFRDAQKHHMRFKDGKPEPGLEVSKPTATLKFYDVPDNFSKDDVNKILGLYAAPSPMEVTVERDESGKVYGYLKYHYANQATDAVLVCNNVKIPTADGEQSDAIFKLSFTSEGDASSAPAAANTASSEQAAPEASGDGAATTDAAAPEADAAATTTTAADGDDGADGAAEATA
ncbi:hypothetical protein PTSG_05929 [Salpingoeca rosetta]|uniref:RRM domain-containing protein n=1 Tax=Salpingoeca rosetta (strain ATCC 50818 / BSB-021) TaxID=946362 RepID=F2UD70_SALR5|nr:uncharacterized protein PTSG_05929 [Salpingoeca rosetta]EGD74565.1 hypothetical protein PTSG_05929 [Salpingoeca rosetta]|eukprot:XP_004992822.1 hypothetical protein PTSG_05929 [Salpingoeca rosetta]